jgi:hypothetical protein
MAAFEEHQLVRRLPGANLDHTGDQRGSSTFLGDELRGLAVLDLLVAATTAAGFRVATWSRLAIHCSHWASPVSAVIMYASWWARVPVVTAASEATCSTVDSAVSA